MSISPADPLQVAIAWQVPTRVGWSADSGRTWQTGARVPGMEAYQSAGDPIVFYDADGHVYALSIAFDRPGDFRALGRAARRNGIFVNRSDDGGATWRALATAVTAQPELPGIPSRTSRPARSTRRRIRAGAATSTLRGPDSA